MSTEFEEDLNIAIGAEDEHEKLDEKSDIDNNDDSEQDIDNESLLSNGDSDQDDSEDVAPEETNIINESEEYSIESENETENEEAKDIALEQSNNEGLWEDIYGRQRDKEGNIVSKKYVPPAARATIDTSVSGEEARRLQRQLKGILNRLAEQNMHTIANQVIDCKCIYICDYINGVNHKLLNLYS